jgi:hypothetical protein
MLGTGTQLDPYQITTVAEFRSMNDSTAYYKLMNDLDVNDSEWATGWTAPTLTFKELDGSDFKFRNAICLGGFITLGNATNVFKNMTFQNIILSSAYSFCSSAVSGATVTFEKCILEIHNGYTFRSTNATTLCQLKECTITLNNLVGVGSTPFFYKTSIERCMVKFNNCKLPPTSQGALHQYGGVTGATIISSCFLGDLTLQSNLTRDEIYRYGLISRYTSGNPVQRSYFAFTLNKNGYTIAENYPFISYSGNINNSFYDAELMGHTFASKSGLSALTTEQCKDKDYLNSIGFLVV